MKPNVITTQKEYDEELKKFKDKMKKIKKLKKTQRLKEFLELLDHAESRGLFHLNFIKKWRKRALSGLTDLRV